ncbi:MAG: hypothetical protein HUU56_11965 [Bdellovibrionaceae bacterium]|nr:hypothetical protein [Pseudobdellovibrionaceae bacterium]
MGELKLNQEVKKTADFGVDASDFGSSDSLRYRVLTQVAAELYEQAIEDLKKYYALESDYPTFKKKIERFINHSIDLIFAIKAKRNFPGINQLTRAKQQELRERFKEHFKELVYMLKRIEKIEKDLQVEDARSTIYVIKAFWVSAIVLMMTWFLVEIFRGLAITGLVVITDYSEKILDYLAKLFGL